MTYPATNFEEAVSNTITSSDQLHQIINGSTTDTVTTDSGEIPSVRKALTDNMYFVEAIPWSQGSNETVFNQLRTFTDNAVYWAPNATVTTPIPMGATPDGDSNWTLAPVSLTEEKIRQVSSEIANAGDSQLFGGEIYENPVTVGTLVPSTAEAIWIQGTLYPLTVNLTSAVTGINLLLRIPTITTANETSELLNIKYFDRLRVNVKSFWAAGDRVADDTTAFRSALATGKSVYVPNGEYRITDTLHLNSGQRVYGDSSRNLNAASALFMYGTNDLFVIDSSNLNYKEACSIERLYLINSGTSKVGIHILGNGVLDINDWHRISETQVRDFTEAQIKVTGRTIWSTFEHVALRGGDHGFLAVDGLDSPLSFNANTFTNVSMNNCQLEGLSVAKGQSCSWIGCNFEGCNLSNTDGIAAVKVTNSESFIFQNCYLESNGMGCTNDRTDVTSCSYGYYFTGTYNYAPQIIGGYNVLTGIPFHSDTLQLVGGRIDGGRVGGLSGVAIWTKTANIAEPWGLGSPFTIGSNIKVDNSTGDYIVIEVDGTQRRSVWIEQSGSTYWDTVASRDTLDFYRLKDITFNNANTNRTITTFQNNYPGQSYTIWNFGGTGNVIIDGSLTYDGADIIIVPNDRIRLDVLGYPFDRKVRSVQA